ncbi:Endonuclease/Exonuclease/phosphatase family protein [Anaerohalosphaera lusitana]|uniref:Endonuclease/Exonuclease/phosphatase family protein n=1 Tax=Anaerohalosphaera lusitana TaxID=1936003 RepID=A0A1U9NPB3_9BACT|nr:endonuclease/exonuclease/phosphatase family protein [Anaerohalosphaera lusitana]AQT69761.1 Endonuclease/Exonuclease/phosphatase family protein [Anaerohalosphaera lusitana]
MTLPFRILLPAVIFTCICGFARGIESRDSLNFITSLEQIEGNVLPGTLSSWTTTNIDGKTTINGDGTMTVSTSDSSFDAWSNAGTVDSSIGWTWEARLRIDSDLVAGAPVFDMISRDNTGEFAAPWIMFFANGISDRGTTGDYGATVAWSADMSTNFRTVRMAYDPYDGNGTRLWLDGELLATNIAGDFYNASSMIFIGRWSAPTKGGQTTIDYIRFDTTGAYSPSAALGNVVISGDPVVYEDGPTADTFTVSLGVAPVEDVTITLAADDQISLDIDKLVFTPDNWNTAQTITVTAIDDEVAEESTHNSDITFSVTSADEDYDDVAVTPLTVLIYDNNLCGPGGYLTADVNKDCIVDLADLAEIARQWLACTVTNRIGCYNVNATELKVMTFNILSGGDPVATIGATSPLYYKNRYQDIANVIIESGADIVGITEHNTSNPDPILTALQANDSSWRKLGKIYAKFAIEQDPYNPSNSSRNSYAYRVNFNEDQWIYVHVAHWWPSGGYGPMVVQNRIINGSVPADLEQFEQEILNTISIQETYNYTRDRLQTHIDAGRPVVLMGDFNEASHLDWTADYMVSGADRWINNSSGTPLRFDIEWRGSKTMTDAGMVDAYRAIFPDPVAKPGNTWTPPYANNTPGRRPYDADAPDGPNQVVDRIDWIMYAGKGVMVTDAAVIGENPNNPEHQGKSEIQPDIRYSGSWPSDHRGVIATFKIER